MYGPRSPRATKLDAFKGYLLQRIQAARPHWIPAVVLLREITQQDETGGLAQFKQFIHGHRENRWSRLCDSRWRQASRCRRTSRTSAKDVTL